jgi:hypothetical protein
MIGQATKKAIIEVQLDDKASSGLKKLQTNTDSISSKMKVGFNKIAVAVAATTAAIGGATAAIMSMASRAGKIESLSLGFERNFGDMEKALESFRKASAGMVSDFDLMQTANRAALLGVTSDVDKLSGLMVTARLRGREMGLDMTQAFNDIVTGIGRGSPLILDNLGIKIPDAIKKSMEKMGEAEKTQALLNFAIADGAKIAAEYGDVQLTASEKAEVLKSKIVNLKDEALAKLSEPLGKIIDQFSKWIDKLEKVAKETADLTKDEVSALKDALTNPDYGLVKGVGDMDTAWGNLMEAFTGENKNAVETMIQMFVGWAYILTELSKLLEKLFNWIVKVKGKWDEYQISSMEEYKSNHSEDDWRYKLPGNKATGGVTSGGLTLVGERGAELVSLPRGSHVYNSEDTKQMVGNNGITINVNAPVTGVDNLKAVILEAVNEATERQNRLANYNLL